jgi:hypothetical protein
MVQIWVVDPKSGPHIIRGPVKSARIIHLAGEEKGFRGKPCSPATAAELLHRDDDSPGLLSSEQRQLLEAKAAKKYKKIDPFLKRSTETTEEYVRRINKLVG